MRHARTLSRLVAVVLVVGIAAGIFYLWSRTSDDRSGVPGAVDKSISYYQQAVKLDPKFGKAYAGLADAYTLDLGYPESAAARAEHTSE